MASDITVASELISTAATLGLPVPAPAATHYYYAHAIQHGNVFDDSEELVAGRHTSRQSAMNQILTYVMEQYDTPGRVSGPWLTYLEDQNNFNPTPAEITEARQHYLNTHTDEQIADNYLAVVFGQWSITEHSIAAPTPAPFTRSR